MLKDIFEFIREYFSILIIGVSIIFIIVLVIITLLKNDNNNTVSDLSLSKEKTASKNTKDYVNKIAIFRRDIQEYLVYVFDSNSKEIFTSDVKPSQINANSLIEKMKSSKDSFAFRIEKNLDNKYYYNLYIAKDYIGYTIAFDSLEEASSFKDEFFKYISFNEVTKYTERSQNIYLIQSKKNPNKKRSKDAILFDKSGSIFRYEIQSSDNVILYRSLTFSSKGELKKNKSEVIDSIISKNFIIHETEDGFRYELRTKTKHTLGFGKTHKSIKEVEKDIDDLVASI